MSARYIVRFDDICPTMNWSVWERIETVLHRHSVRPIVAVVPDNHDAQLAVDPPRADFWDRVRSWQATGWTIALHGHQHLYTTHEPGLLKINRFSEFAGLTEEAQRTKLVQALAIFEREGVRADAWVAPAHSFDATTVKLLLELGVSVISDGFCRRVTRHLGAVWVPQQFWRFRSAPAGLWTVCYHHNGFDDLTLKRFDSDIAHYASRIVSVANELAVAKIPAQGWGDRALSAAWLAALRYKRQLSAA